MIFLVTEHEQLGVQAWLEAYHKATCGRSGVLDHGDMMGRGGAIQVIISCCSRTCVSDTEIC